MTTPSEKPDLSIVTAAAAETEEAQRKFDASAESVRAARAALKDVQADYEAAAMKVANGEPIDPASAMTALRDARDRLEFVNSVAGKLLDNLESAQQRQLAAQAEAHRPVFLAGVQARLLGAKRIDDAVTEFHAAFSEYQRGAVLIGKAKSNGFEITANGHGELQYAGHLAELQHRLPEPGSVLAGEAGFWAGVGLS